MARRCLPKVPLLVPLVLALLVPVLLLLLVPSLLLLLELLLLPRCSLLAFPDHSWRDKFVYRGVVSVAGFDFVAVLSFGHFFDYNRVGFQSVSCHVVTVEFGDFEFWDPLQLDALAVFHEFRVDAFPGGEHFLENGAEHEILFD